MTAVGHRDSAGGRRGLGLRATFGLLSGVTAVTVVVLAVFLGLSLVPQAVRIRQSTEPVSYLLREMAARAKAADGAVRSAEVLVAGQARPGPAELQRLRNELGAVGAMAVGGYATVPAPVRTALARADDEISRLESRLEEVVALAELGRLGEARARVLMADSLQNIVEETLASAQRQGLADLLVREAQLDRAAGRAGWTAGVLVLVALVLPGLFLLVAQRRIDRPLAGLSAALDRVGTGDLTVQLPVPRHDELGLLAEHFNAMTRVLRDRAEGQGRFAATGELLAGMAHEVNNPLQAITTLAESRLDEPTLAPGTRGDLQKVLQQARRAGKLLGGLLHFVRPGEPQPEALDVADVVGRVVDLLSYQFGVDEIQVDNRVRESPLRVRADAARLEQLFVNLLSNAIDAVRAAPTPRRITIEGWEHRGAVHLGVTDNGPGIERDVAARLFQPFVTTKGSRGTGLGLYVSRQLAREVGGDLELRSSPGEGARFVAWFPATAAAPGPASPAAAPAAPPAAGALAGITILVVDDEEGIRRPLARYLGRMGATVVDAADGLEALTQLGLFAVDAIVLDLRMPRMDGIECYAAIRRERPALAGRTLFLSGDPQQLADAPLTSLPADRVLAKPVDLSVLTDRIRRLVGRASPTGTPRPWHA